MIAKRLSNPSVMVENRIRQILKEKADRNSDGFFIKTPEGELRTIDDRIANPTIQQVNLDDLMLHFRFATAGKITENNVHGWEIGDWKFLHNGHVSGYTINHINQNIREREDSDSLSFFKDLVLFLNEINSKKDKQVARVIQQMVKDTNFSGRAVLYNMKTDKMYLFGDFHIYCFGDSHIVISSATLDLNTKIDRSVHGFDVQYNREAVVGEQTTYGIGVIHNYSRSGFQYKYIMPLYIVTPTPSTPAPSTVPHSPYTRHWNDDDTGEYSYDKDDTTYCRKPVNDIQPTPEQQTMIDNIARADTEVIDEEVDALTLETLQNNFGFIGYDKTTGEELYIDNDGIHDLGNKCCMESRCRDFNNLDDIDFSNLDTVTPPLVDGIVQFGTLLKEKKKQLLLGLH